MSPIPLRPIPDRILVNEDRGYKFGDAPFFASLAFAGTDTGLAKRGASPKLFMARVADRDPGAQEQILVSQPGHELIEPHHWEISNYSRLP